MEIIYFYNSLTEGHCELTSFIYFNNDYQDTFKDILNK